jgi:hypothetical protein
MNKLKNEDIKEVSFNFDYKRLIKPMLAIGVTTSIITATYLFADKYTLSFRSPFQNPIIINERVIEIEYKEPVLEATESAKTKEEVGLNILYSGKVSYYSHSGCLGCGESQTMGNGEAFDENDNTLAIPCEDIVSGKYKYDTVVKVVNQDNFKQETARITDCGGFSKYGRIADLSLGLANRLEATTDRSNIVIYK